MQRHNFDANVYDFTWKQNRLAKDKDALKRELMNLIQKKPKKEGNDEQQAKNNKEKEVSKMRNPEFKLYNFKSSM